MKFSEGLPQIMGKRICGAIAKEGDRSPRTQVFLIFDDGTYMEFYSTTTFTCAAGVDQGGFDEVRNYLPDHRIVFECGENQA